MRRLDSWTVFAFICFALMGVSHAASIIVAASNSTVEAKARADYVCDGPTTTEDSSLNSNDGTLNGSPMWISGHIGTGALSFDGIDDNVDITGYKGITGTGSRTISAWIKTDYSGTIISWGEDTTGGRWVFRTDNTGPIRVTFGGGNVIGSTNIFDGQYHHVAAVLDDDGSPIASEIKLYVDGQPESTTYSDVAINTGNTADVRIGSAKHFLPTSTNFNGVIDDVRIYDITLDDIAILDIYNNSIQDSGLVGYWKLDEGSGADDHVELLQSITDHAIISNVDVLLDNNTTVTVQNCYSKHSVEWLPGDYYLGAALQIPNASDLVIKAEGTVIHGTNGNNAVVIRGMNRCRYYFGEIRNNLKDNNAAALRLRPNQGMPACYSKVCFAALRGIESTPGSGIYNGTGLHLVPSEGRIFANEFKGTDISHLNIGIKVDDAIEACNTNWFLVNFIREAHQCIYEMGVNVERNFWQAKVDAWLENSEGIRTAASHGKWYLMIGTGAYVGINNALVLEPGASHNVIEMHPSIDNFAWQDNSGGNLNVILSSTRPPYKP